MKIASKLAEQRRARTARQKFRQLFGLDTTSILRGMPSLIKYISKSSAKMSENMNLDFMPDE